MEEKVKCSIRIPVSIMNSVKEESARTGKNISTCIVERLQRSRKVSAPNNEKTSWIGVDQDAKKSLMFAADQAGISASDYIRRLLAPSPPASYFADIRTYIQTCRLHNISEFDALSRLTRGSPYTLQEIT